MEILFIIGRILFGGFFLMSGLNHLFLKREMLVGYSAQKGVPSPKLAVFLTGLMVLLGGLGVIIWQYLDVSLWLLIIFLFGSSVKMHDFWNVQDEMQKMGEMTNFMKNMALLGAALILLAI
ncbi:DoxX family protein [Candidatus Campbellbacteria bacterium CG11_big_fil_rev_8_21_14_0_20_44_21]|uniref:DoxX family protein n=1 Tax=Candidatus Campbellbacteria bacterium CG22_combo_CG10-13_8_21_14_all_43_18 TaxID=1974530 RepID=A0A2H0DWX0_9BACT|nr:MAG: DoxX family protein [Candidatus Campbellbacteria bacterium CG22_combo_CG10-13_8_21_14_all_43_18]PIR24484.1 MAG: DoxX family protein [Candidatus Campbellbacteria bacterium CG11_big_fil_rev_8_21_14_0_20_44_21]